VDATRRSISFKARVVNLMEATLSGGYLRLAVEGALAPANGHPLHLTRKLPGLLSQEKMEHNTEFTLQHFSCCKLHLQVLFTGGTSASADGELQDEGDEAATDTSQLPITLRCLPYQVPLSELLLPCPTTPGAFFHVWPRLQEVQEYMGVHAIGSGQGEPLEGLVSAMHNKPFSLVCRQQLPACASFQECYSAQTWFDQELLLMVFGYAHSNGRAVWCKFVLRSQSREVLQAVGADVQVCSARRA
ncbi:hypothetical protein CYMTET_26625, partial [Cymbomonas tetramitiformis]